MKLSVLKEINEFNYSHSEKLGDAYEYLLSFMGSDYLYRNFKK